MGSLPENLSVKLQTECLTMEQTHMSGVRESQEPSASPTSLSSLYRNLQSQNVKNEPAAVWTVFRSTTQLHLEFKGTYVVDFTLMRTLFARVVQHVCRWKRIWTWIKWMRYLWIKATEVGRG